MLAPYTICLRIKAEMQVLAQAVSAGLIREGGDDASVLVIAATLNLSALADEVEQLQARLALEFPARSRWRSRLARWVAGL